MHERRPCFRTYNAQTHVGCDLYAGHDGPCDTTHSQAQYLRRCEDALGEAERALYLARGEQPPRNRTERRATHLHNRKRTR